MDSSKNISNENKINLQLGDIIQIISPNNSKYDNNIYLIDYIDDEIIKIIGKDNIDILYLGKTGQLTDFSIKEIHILKRSKNNSYIVINNLKINTWINIHFGGQFPGIVTGLIVNIIEDMIEVKTVHPIEDVIFIDFAYKGIPRELNIDYIEIRDEPESVKEMRDQPESLQEMQDDEEGESEEKEEELLKDSSVDSSQDSQEINELDEIPIDKIENEYNQEIVDLQDEGEILGMVTQYVNVKKHKQRFTLDEQRDDMINNYFDKISYSKQTEKEKESISKFISRYIDLRENFTIFDKNENPLKIKKTGENYSTLKEILYNTNNKLKCFLPITSLKKILYIDEGSNFKTNDISYENYYKKINKEFEEYNNYMNKITGYVDYMNIINEFLIPYERDTDRTELYSLKCKQDVSSIIDTDQLYEVESLTGMKLKYQLQKFISSIEFNDKKIMMNETLDISGLITLPFQYANLSRIHLNRSNILDKYILSNKAIFDSFLFKEGIKLKTNIVSQFNEKFENNNNYKYVFNHLTEHLLDDDIIKNKNNYEKFFSTALPKSSDIIKYVVKKYKLLSLFDYFKLLESYNIYEYNIHFTQYKILLDEVYKNISIWWDTWKPKNREFINASKIYSKLNRQIQNKENVNLLEIASIKDYYRKNENCVSNSELLEHINNYDNRELLIEQMKLNTLGLINDVDIDYSKLLLDNNNSENTEKKCKNYTISKKYNSKDELTNDNDNTIFFDKEYDDTVYDILGVYKKEQNSMEKKEFLDFLKNKLVTVNGIKDEDAEKISETIVRGRKIVEDGDYAIVQNISDDYEKSNIEYFKRINNKWVFDKEATDSKIKNNISINTKICEPVTKCIEDLNTSKNIMENYKNQDVHELQNKLINEYGIDKENSKKLSKNIITKDEVKMTHEDKFLNLPVERKLNCISSNDKKKAIKNKIIKSIMEEYKHKNLSKTINIEENIQKIISRNIRLNEIKVIESKVYENFKLLLGSTVNELPLLKSPYIAKFNEILLYKDIFYKHKELLVFIHKYTRSSIYPEDKYWYYCKSSNVKLVPTFYFKLANVIIKSNNLIDNSDYIEVVRQLYKEQGYEEDGIIYDKYSNEMIAPLDFDINDGYNQFGVRNIVQDNIQEEEEDENDIIEKIIDEELKQSGTIEEPGDGYYKTNTKEFVSNIVNYVTSELNINLGDHKEYIVVKTVIIFQKYKNKKNEEYTLVLITVAMIFVGVQMFFPKLTGKYIRVNDCKTSFKGYPLQDKTDYSGIEFFSCLISKRKGKINKRVTLIDQEKIKNQLITIIDKLILENIQDDLIDIKKDQNERDELLSKFIKKNLTYLPPLSNYNIAKISLQNNLSSLVSNIKRQTNVLKIINEIKGKNIMFSYGLMELINKEITKFDLNLENHATNKYYIENSCCSSDLIVNIIQYLKDKEKNIERYISIVKENEKYLNSINYLPSTFISNESNKNFLIVNNDTYTNKTVELFFKKYVLDDEYQEKTYNGMIQKISDIYNLANKKQISKISNITLDDYLISVLTKTHTIELDNSGNKNDIYEKMINYIRSTKDATKMQDIILQKVHLSEELDNKIDSLKNEYKMLFNDRSSKIIESFINLKSKNSSQIIKNNIKKYTFIIPSLIISNCKVHNRIKLPKHWNLSVSHYSDIQKYISDYYTFSDKFYDNDNIKSILEFSLIKYKQFEYLLSNIDVLIFKEEDYFIDREMVNKILYYVFLSIITFTINNHNTIEEKNKYKELLKEYNLDFSNFVSNYDFNNEDLKKKILKAKEREKDRMTRKLKKKTDQEREISNILKENKLGEWAIGEQSGFRKYDKNFRDLNRPENEEINTREDERTEFSEMPNEDE